MNKIQELAYRNVKKYKKHYLFVSILIFCVSVFFISVSLIWSNYYLAQKDYNQDYYGEWYWMAEIQSYYEPSFEKAISLYDNSINLQYGYIYNQGITKDNYWIGYAQEFIYDFCNLKRIDGYYPRDDFEIMITDRVSKEKGINIGDSLLLQVNYENEQEYKVVGIIHNSQEGVFPDIYTHINKGITTFAVSNYRVSQTSQYNDDILENQDYHFEIIKEIYNKYGYVSSAVFESFNYSIQQLTVLVESLVLVVFALLALTTTSLKRRNREFALCRGIGMTTKQLFAMIFYEMLYSSVVSVFLASIVSIGVSYIGALYYSNKLGYLVFNISLNTILLDIFILLVVILLSMLIPIYSSATYALSGVFDSKKFKHIQVRYKELKYQTKSRIAVRELLVHKKITFCLFGLLAFLMIFYSMVLVKPDYTKISNNHFSFNYYRAESDYEKIVKQKQSFDLYMDIHSLDSHISSYMNAVFIAKRDGVNYQIDKKIGCLKYNEDYSKMKIDGRFPENKNEVLVSYTNYNGNLDKDFKIGDSFEVDGEKYVIVGNVLPNEVIEEEGDYSHCDIYYYSLAELYVYEDVFQSWSDMFGFDEIFILSMYYYDEYEEMFIKDIFTKYSYYDWLYSSEDEINFITSRKELSYGYLQEIDMTIIPILVLISFVSLYYLNKNEMYNNSSDIALMKLIGMTNKEMLLKQCHKAFIQTIAILLFEAFWILMLNIYFKSFIVPIVGYLISVIVLLIINMVIYCLPMKDLLNNNVFDLIHGDE